MNDDKYIGIEVLTNVLSGVTEMIDQRTALLNSMFKEDLYNDFLMAEAMQGGMGGAGVDNVAPIGMGMPDLSIPQAPDSKQVVNVEDANLNTSDIGDIDPINTSGSGNNTTQNFNKGGITPSSSSSGEADAFQPANKPSSKSLEETGFNDVIEKNISNKIADDFQVDQRLKDAFGKSLALPMKAAGVGLMGLLSRIPASDSEMQETINNSLSTLSSALGVSTENSEVNLSTTSEENVDLATRIQNWIYKGANWLVSKGNPDGQEKPMGGSITKIHGINQGGGGPVETIKNFFGLAKDRDHEVSEETMMGAAVTGLQKRRQMNDLYMQMLNGGGGGVSPNINDQGGLTKIIESMNNTININKNNLEGITSTQNFVNANDLSSTADQRSFITDLTNTVFQENSELLAAKYDTETIKNSIINATSAGPSTKIDMEGPGELSLSQVKQSVFFSEYANTAQFS